MTLYASFMKFSVRDLMECRLCDYCKQLLPLPTSPLQSLGQIIALNGCIFPESQMICIC